MPIKGAELSCGKGYALAAMGPAGNLCALFLANEPRDFDLADAVDDRNDGQGGGIPNVNPGGGMLMAPADPMKTESSMSRGGMPPH